MSHGPTPSEPGSHAPSPTRSTITHKGTMNLLDLNVWLVSSWPIHESPE
jgi:hypothetical protein